MDIKGTRAGQLVCRRHSMKFSGGAVAGGKNARMPECHQIQWIWANPVDLQAFPAWTRGFTKVKCKQLTNNRKKWTIFHSQFENWAIVHIYGGHTWWPKNHMKPINSGSELRPRPVHRMESGSQNMTNAIANFGEEHQESRPTPQHFTFNLLQPQQQFIFNHLQPHNNIKIKTANRAS